MLSRSMRHVFVSYCREDAGFAGILDERIKMEFPTFSDPDAVAEESWNPAIEGEIKAALAMIVIMSPSSQKSPCVNYQWAFALGANVEVLPVLLERCEDPHPRLGMMQHLDFGQDANQPWNRLLESLRAVADRYRPYTLRVPPDAPPVVKEAARSLDSANADERDSAFESLCEMNHPAADELMLEALSHPIPNIRFGAAYQMANRRDIRALPVLMEACWDGVYNANYVSKTIQSFGISAFPTMTRFAKDQSSQMSGLAMEVLAQIDGKAAVPILVECLADPAKRERAAYALAETHDESALPAIRELIHSLDARVRRNIAAHLKGFTAAMPLMAELSHDPDYDVRVRAVAELRDWGDSAAVPILIEALDEFSWAAAGLGRIGDPSAIPALIETGSGCLENFGQDAVPGLRAVLHDENPKVRAMAVQYLGSLGDETDIPELLKALGDANPWVRAAAVRGLGGKKDPQMVPAFIERLTDQDEQVCKEAAEALGVLGDPNAVPHLIACLEDGEIAEAAASALERIDTREARGAIRRWKKQQK